MLKKQINVTIEGKSYAITYTKEGDSYRVESTDPEISRHIPGVFYVINGIANYVVVSAKTHLIFGQIIPQIHKNEFR